jgi:hypothetical protein
LSYVAITSSAMTQSMEKYAKGSEVVNPLVPTLSTLISES